MKKSTKEVKKWNQALNKANKTFQKTFLCQATFSLKV